MRFLKRWPLIFLFALATIVLSAGGYFFCLPAAHRPGPVDWLAATMSFFRMYWSWPHDLPVPWPLQAARLTGAIVTLSALTKVWMKLFREQTGRFRLSRWRGHVVICGLGGKGLDLALAFRQLARRVVILDSRPDEDDAQLCRENGALVETGDATKDHALETVGAERARHLFAVCKDDGTNLEIAMQTLTRFRECRQRGPLSCYVHLVSPSLRALLQRNELLKTRTPGFDLRFFTCFFIHTSSFFLPEAGGAGRRRALRAGRWLSPGHPASRALRGCGGGRNRGR